jgi:hypothetical protein
MFRLLTFAPFALAFVLSFALREIPVARADFAPDLAIATQSPGLGIHCAGDSTGGFTCNSVQGEVTNSFGVAAGDVDGDHQIDLVFANAGRENGICYGTSTPNTFSCSTVEPEELSSISVALGNTDGGPSLDIVYANSASDRDQVCSWIGMGLFDCTDVSADELSSFDVVLGDVDRNTTLDALFATASTSEQSRVCLGDGLGGFTCNSIANTFRASFGIALADFNADAVLDIAIANDRQANQVCTGNGDGTFACSDIEAVDRQSFDVAVGDFNGDGDPDLVFANQNSDEGAPNAGPNRVCYGKSGMAFACENLSSEATDTFGVAVADWNRDGLDDIAVANSGSPSRICLGDDAPKSTFLCSNISEDSFNARDITAIVPPPIYPVENDFEVEGEENECPKRAPSISSAPGHGSVVAWRIEADTNNQVWARRYDPDGLPIGDPIPVETLSDGEPRGTPDVSMAPDGSFVVVWDFDDPGPQHLGIPGEGVSGRRFDASGTPLGPEFVISSLTIVEAPISGRVAQSADGSFLVTWSTFGDPGNESTFSIMGRLYNAAGQPQGDEFVIDDQDPGSHENPCVAARPDGSFVVAWERDEDDIFARIANADGSIPGAEIHVNIRGEGTQRRPAVATASGGGFVVTWDSNQDLDNSFGIRARVFDDTGTPLTDEIAVNEPSSDRQEMSRIAFGAGGRFVVTWRDFNVSRRRGAGIGAQEFEPLGKKVGAQFEANRSIDEIGDVSHPDVTGVNDGRVVFAWAEDRSTQTIRGEVFRRRFESPNIGPMGVTTTTLLATTTTSTASVSTTFRRRQRRLLSAPRRRPAA